MKSYEEMTRCILSRVEEEKKMEKKRRKIVGTAAICVCSVALAVLMGVRLPINIPEATPENTTAVISSQTSGITLLHATGNGDAQQKLIKDVVVPFSLKIRVRDVRGQDRAKVLEEEKAYAKAAQEVSRTENCMEQYISEAAIITLVSDGHFCLIMEDYSQVQDVFITTTQTGLATFGPYTRSGEGESGVMVFWTLSDETIGQIEKNPALKLSEIQDTVTVTLEFKDGSTESAVIDMTVDDEGQVYAVQRGISVTA